MEKTTSKTKISKKKTTTKKQSPQIRSVGKRKPKHL
jgi:hypothetical protein